MNLKNKKKVLVFVHDAGGAEVIAAYIHKNQKYEHFLIYGAGPAKKIFARLHIPLKHASESSADLRRIVEKHHNAASVLIAAPGWMTKTETNAIKEAKRANLRTVVYMDSWEDERKRFGYPSKGWKKILPHEFWAGDRYAYANLRKQYPDISVRLVPNQYFVNELFRYQTLKKKEPPPKAILFLSQDRPGSDDLLKELIHVLENHKKGMSLRIRHHPIDDRNRYNAIIKSARSRVDIVKSSEKDLVKDLLFARIVVGTETTALAVAALCGIKAISFLPKGARRVLPFPKIKRIRSVSEIQILIR